MDKYRNESDFRSGLALVDRLEALLRSTMDTYYELTQSMHKWCDVAINHLQSYLQQLQRTTKDEAMKQHLIAIQLLKDGSEKVPETQQKLQNASSNFDELSDVRLIVQLDEDFDDYNFQSTVQIDYIKSLCENSRKCVLFVCWDTDETRHLKSTIRELEENLAKAKILNNELKEAIKKAEYKADVMKANFETESNAMLYIRSEARIAVHTINTIVEEDAFDPEVNNLIEVAIENLIEECRKYQARREPLK